MNVQLLSHGLLASVFFFYKTRQYCYIWIRSIYYCDPNVTHWPANLLKHTFTLSVYLDIIFFSFFIHYKVLEENDLIHPDQNNLDYLHAQHNGEKYSLPQEPLGKLRYSDVPFISKATSVLLVIPKQ